MTKDTGEQLFAKACREYTLPRSDGSSQPRGWIQETQKLDLCWKSRPVACMANMESLNEDNTTPGLEFLMDQINL